MIKKLKKVHIEGNVDYYALLKRAGIPEVEPIPGRKAFPVQLAEIVVKTDTPGLSLKAKPVYVVGVGRVNDPGKDKPVTFLVYSPDRDPESNQVRTEIRPLRDLIAYRTSETPIYTERHSGRQRRGTTSTTGKNRSGLIF